MHCYRYLQEDLVVVKKFRLPYWCTFELTLRSRKNQPTYQIDYCSED